MGTAYQGNQTDLTKNKIEAAGLTIHPTSDGFLYTAPCDAFHKSIIDSRPSL